MKTLQAHLKGKTPNLADLDKLKAINPQLVLMFGSIDTFAEGGLAQKASEAFKDAIVIGCSTAGEIAASGVHDNSLVVTASHFDKPNFKSASAPISSMEGTKEAGVKLAQQFDQKDLKAIFVLGRGLDINGSALIDGIRSVTGPSVIITGGLAGDGGKFQRTVTLLNGQISDSCIVAFGVYGDNFHIAFGSMGGWEPFGPVRRVTKSVNNVLYELDGEPALAIYKKYLGDKAKDLPASGLLYPFALLKENQDTSGTIRTILGVNEEDQSVTLAGDIPMNGIVRLMHASNDKLVEGAQNAAEMVAKKDGWKQDPDALGILISCVGRKLVMGEDTDDELDAVKEVFGKMNVTGFYSYGEICETGFSECKLHNQTMTITYLSEKK
jgi:hypothetical protein